MGFMDMLTKKKPPRTLSPMEVRADAIIAEAGYDINADIASARYTGLTPSQIVLAKLLARNVALNEAILAKLSR